MSNILIYDTIRDTVQSYLPGARVMLFGSRARGNADRQSDYDLLIITPRTFTPQEKIIWSTRLDKLITVKKKFIRNWICLGTLYARL